jgi:hypothetical protein
MIWVLILLDATGITCGSGRNFAQCHFGRTIQNDKRSVQEVSSTQNSDNANQNPKRIQHNIRGVTLERRTPCKHDGIGRIEEPDEHERTLRPEPAYQAEAEHSHEHACHFNGFNVLSDE